MKEEPAEGVGRFYMRPTGADEWEEPLAGSISRSSGWVELTVLAEEDAPLFGPTPFRDIEAIACSLPDSEMLLLEIRDGGGATQMMNNKASTRRFQARTAMTGVPLGRVTDPRPISIEAHFFGLGLWSGLAGLKEHRSLDETTSLLNGYTLELSSEQGVRVELGDGVALELGTTWQVSGTSEDRRVRAPVSVRAFDLAGEPRPLADLLVPLLHVQDLVNCSHACFVPASGGRADFAGRPLPDDYPQEVPHGSFWNGALAEALPGVRVWTNNTDTRAMLSLESIGGVAALPAWIKMSTENRRAIGPLSDRFRHGAPYDFAEFLTLVAACETWAQSFLPKSAYSGQRFNWAVANAAGPHFAEWCGGIDAWSREVTRLNRMFKHESRGVEPTPRHLRLMVEGLWTLVLCINMNKLAGSDLPTSHIVEAAERYNLGARIRDALRAPAAG